MAWTACRRRDIGFGLLGVIGVVLGIMFADMAFEDADAIFPEGGKEIPVEGPEGDPGGVLVPVDVPVAGPVVIEAPVVLVTDW